MSRILIHFQDSDKDWAGWVEKVLKEAGYNCELYPWDHSDGTTFYRKLELYWKDHKTYILPILSPQYLAGVHSKQEWVFDVKHSATPVLPIRVKRCIVENQIFSRLGKYVDAVSTHQDNTKYMLLEEARRLIGPPQSKTEGRLQAMSAETLKRQVFHLPAMQNEHFSGREKIMQGIHQSLFQHRLAAIASDDQGFGGVGRRQIAVELAHRRAGDYRVVWWVRANHPSSLILDFARLAESLGLEERKAGSMAATVQAVRHWLSKNEGWLLIFDRLRKQDYLKRFLPASYRGQALVTTSTSVWNTNQYRFILRDMDRQESVQLLNRLTGQIDEGAAAAVGARVRDFPLSLRLAAGYANTAKIRLSEYFDRFEAAGKNYKDTIDAFQDRKIATAFVALAMNLEVVKSLSSEAADLIRVCAHLAPDDIRLVDLSGGQKFLPPRLQKLVTDQPALNKSVKMLDGMGLVELDAEQGKLSMHPLIQRLVQQWMILPTDQIPAGRTTLMMRLSGQKEDRMSIHDWRAQTLNMLSNAIPEDGADREHWSEYNRLMPHAFNVLQYTQSNPELLKEVSTLQARMGEYFEIRGLHTEACQVLQLALQSGQAAYGAKDVRLANLEKLLGKAMWGLGKLPEACQRLERALAIDQAHHHKAPSSVVSKDHTVLGSLLEEMDDLFAARKHYEAALAIDQQLGDNHKGLQARDHANLGLVDQRLGDCSLAWRHYEKALELSRDIYGEKHASISILLKNMGGLTRDLGDLPRAKEFMKRAIEMDRALYGADHPELSRGYSNYGLILQELGELDEAREYHELALAIDKAVYGPTHRKVAIRMNNVASVLQAKGEFDTARKYYEYAYKVLERAFGKDHPLVAIAQQNLDQLDSMTFTNNTPPPTGQPMQTTIMPLHTTPALQRDDLHWPGAETQSDPGKLPFMFEEESKAVRDDFDVPGSAFEFKP